MSARKSKRVSGDVFKNEHAATRCSRGTMIVISLNASITSAIHSGCSRCHAATNGDGAPASKVGIGFVSLFSGSDAMLVLLIFDFRFWIFDCRPSPIHNQKSKIKNQKERRLSCLEAIV